MGHVRGDQHTVINGAYYCNLHWVQIQLMTHNSSQQQIWQCSQGPWGVRSCDQCAEMSGECRAHQRQLGSGRKMGNIIARTKKRSGQVSISLNGLETLVNTLSIPGILLFLPPAWSCLPCGVLTLAIQWQQDHQEGAFTGVGTLTSRTSRCAVGGLWYACTCHSSSGISGVLIVLCGFGVLDIRDSRVAFTLCF